MTIKKKDIISFVVLMGLTVFGCLACSSDRPAEGSSFMYYDLSKDDKRILFSFGEGRESSIYEVNADGTGLKTLIPATKDSTYYRPKFSKNGKKIVYVAHSLKDSILNRSIYMADADGKARRKVIDVSGIITGIFFSDCEDKIYYSKASEYKKYSPLASSQPHGIDIYAVNLKNNQVERITQFNAYGIYEISEYDCQHILMHMIGMEDESRMALFPKDNSDNFVRISPSNDPFTHERGIYKSTPVSNYSGQLFSKKFNVFAFHDYRDLLLMDMQDKKAKIVVGPLKSQFNTFIFFNTEKKFLFTTIGKLEFNIVNFDGSGLKTIPIQINSKSN